MPRHTRPVLPLSKAEPLSVAARYEGLRWPGPDSLPIRYGQRLQPTAELVLPPPATPPAVRLEMVWLQLATAHAPAAHQQRRSDPAAFANPESIAAAPAPAEHTLLIGTVHHVANQPAQPEPFP